MKNRGDDLRTKKRSPFRLACGRCFYTLKRYAKWQFSDIKFAQTKQDELYPYMYFEHKTNTAVKAIKRYRYEVPAPKG